MPVDKQRKDQATYKHFLKVHIDPSEMHGSEENDLLSVELHMRERKCGQKQEINSSLVNLCKAAYLLQVFRAHVQSLREENRIIWNMSSLVFDIRGGQWFDSIIHSKFYLFIFKFIFIIVVLSVHCDSYRSSYNIS
jgi:hypothetical protein